MFPTYIVLAHTGITKDDPEFSGEFGLLPCEWVIFDGVHGKAQAEAKASKFRKHFREVQIRQLMPE
jgi:hypothetical protein